MFLIAQYTRYSLYALYGIHRDCKNTANSNVISRTDAGVYLTLDSPIGWPISHAYKYNLG